MHRALQQLKRCLKIWQKYLIKHYSDSVPQNQITHSLQIIYSVYYISYLFATICLSSNRLYKRFPKLFLCVHFFLVLVQKADALSKWLHITSELSLTKDRNLLTFLFTIWKLYFLPKFEKRLFTFLQCNKIIFYNNDSLTLFLANFFQSHSPMYI